MNTSIFNSLNFIKISLLSILITLLSISCSNELESDNSLNNKNIKLSERVVIPSSRLRGFEAGRVGPKDGDDYIGGNYAYSLNFTSNIPQLFEESQNVDFIFFADAADLWGVDYNSSIDGSMIVFADTFTGIKGRTHYVAISSSSLEGVLSNLNGSLSSSEGKNYLKRAKKFRKVMNRSLFSLVKSWEAK